MKPVTITDAARSDAAGIIDYYVTVARHEVAQGFAKSLANALSFVTSSPEAGSPRLREVCRKPCLRVWPTKRFPYLVIYDDGPRNVLILRILHAARDIPVSLRQPE